MVEVKAGSRKNVNQTSSAKEEGGVSVVSIYRPTKTLYRLGGKKSQWNKPTNGSKGLRSNTTICHFEGKATQTIYKGNRTKKTRRV